MPSNAHAILNWTDLPNPRGGCKKPLTARQARKAAGPFTPVYSRPHKNGTRSARRSFLPRLKGKGLVSGRRKAQKWGTYCGMKIERLVRAGAPRCVVDAMRVEVRKFLRELRYRRV